MVRIVKCVEEILVEWVNILQPREAIEDCLKFFAECFRGELDFSGIEAFAVSVVVRGKLLGSPTSYSANLKASTNLWWVVVSESD